jgi:hypothetical protein
MNGFLVLARSSSDDVPMRLCATLADARAFVPRVTWDTVDAVFTQDNSGPDLGGDEIANVTIVQFRDGVPVAWHSTTNRNDGEVMCRPRPGPLRRF